MLCRAWCVHLPQCFPHHHTSSLLCILSFGEKSDCFPIYPDYLSRPDLFSLPVVLVFLGAMTLVYSKERALSEPSTIYLEERFLFRKKTVKRKQILKTVNHSVSLYLELIYRPMQDQHFWFFFLDFCRDCPFWTALDCPCDPRRTSPVIPYTKLWLSSCFSVAGTLKLGHTLVIESSAFVERWFIVLSCPFPSHSDRKVLYNNFTSWKRSCSEFTKHCLCSPLFIA